MERDDMQKIQTAAVLAATIAAAAHAGVAHTGVKPYALESDSQVSVSFVSQSAGAKGSLYFLGHEDSDGHITYAASSDANNLGQFIFQNHGTAAGYTVDLGIFDAGDVMHFAYLITKGVSVAPTGSLFRTDVNADLAYVGLTPMGSGITRIGLEDIRNPAKSDWDHNDVVFDIVALDVPAPGPAALASAAFLIAGLRRRQKRSD